MRKKKGKLKNDCSHYLYIITSYVQKKFQISIETLDKFLTCTL